MSRSHNVPRHVRESSVWFGNSATMDEIELAASVLPHGPAGVWARSVVDRAVERAEPLIASMAGCDGVYWGYGDGDTVTTVSDVVDPSLDPVPLTQVEAMSVRRMLSEGAEGVLVRPYAPVAVIRAPHSIVAAAAPEVPTGSPDVPEGAKTVAIVDEIDRTAVLDLIAVAPGPKVFRRHDGGWHEDEGWVMVLKGVRPPPMVDVSSDEAMVASVEQQVDEATAGQPFKPLKSATEKPAGPVAASGFLTRLQQESDDAAVQLALTAAIDVGEAKAPVATERLRQYWLHGKGALKIRWGTPGAWTRCHRLLSKYMPPNMVPGYCTNLSQRLGGPGIATHVGDVNPVKRVVAAGFKPSQARLDDGTWKEMDGEPNPKRNTMSGHAGKGKGTRTFGGTKKKSQGNALKRIAEMMKADPDARKFFEAVQKMSPAQRRELRQVKKQHDQKALAAIAAEIKRDADKRKQYEELARLSDLEKYQLQKMYRKQEQERQRRASARSNT